MRCLTLIGFLFSMGITAQTLQIDVREDVILIDGVSTAVQKASVEGDIDDFKDFYKSFLKDQFDLKVKKEDEKLVANEVVVNQITDRRGNLILFAYPVEDEVAFTVAYQLGYDVYLNSREFPEETENLKAFTEFFIYHYYYGYLEDHIKDQEKALKKLSKELDEAEKALSKAEKSEGSLNKKIDKVDSRIEKTREKLADLSSDIENDEKRRELNDDIREWQQKKQELLDEKRELEEPRKINSDIVSALRPKVDKLQSELTLNELLFIEARDKVKSYN